MATLLLEVVTAERMLLSEDVEMVIAPGAAGELGILPHHIPLVTTLKPGELRAKRGSEEILLAVSGGFMEVRSDKVTVLASAAEHADEIDELRAQEARARAEALLSQRSHDQDLVQVETALLRALARLRVVERRRSRGGYPARQQQS